MPKITKQLVEYRELLLMITWRDIRIKYKQSLMGFMWAIFMPMIIVSAGVLVKFAFAIISKKPLMVQDIITISVKSIPWAFFVSSIRFSSNSLIANTNLVTKIYFPRIIFPISAIASQLFDFIIAGSVLVVILTILKTGVSVYLFWVPALITILIFFAMGLGILLSAANLFFRDVKYIVEVVLMFAIFFTPVFYEVELFGGWGNLLMLNPVAPILESLNSCVVLHQSPPLGWITYSAVIAISILLLSIGFFNRMEPLFAESI